MADAVILRDLRLRCIVGTLPSERRRKRTILVQVRLETDLRAASLSDELRDTVDYAALHDRIVRAVGSSSFRLIERLAGRVAELCLEERRVRSVEVEVAKPGALRRARTVAVVLRRFRPRRRA